jgi:hypothetical protein
MEGEWLGLVRFYDLEKGERRAIVRSKEIRICGLFHTSERLAETTWLPGSQKIEPFSANTRPKTTIRGTFVFLPHAFSVTINPSPLTTIRTQIQLNELTGVQPAFSSGQIGDKKPHPPH